LSAETVVTVVGHVASEPSLRVTSTGAHVAGFRLASTVRRYDKGMSAWRDADTMFYGVSCWRATAENVAASLQKGQPVIVHGRLKERGYDDKDGIRRTSLEIDAVTVGHDLTRGVATFTKATGPRRDELLDPADLAGDASLPDDHPARTAVGAVADAEQASTSAA
jgi:single-strand DNA-binding protein